MKKLVQFSFFVPDKHYGNVRNPAGIKLFLRWVLLLIYFPGLSLVNNCFAQTFDPHTDCVNGCTSKDVQIKTAYLVSPTPPNNPLPTNFSCNFNEQVNVKLALDLTTKTPRVGVYIFAHIRDLNNDTIISTVSECFSTALSSGGVTKVVFTQAVIWTCGTPIKLTDVYIGWGTGNTDFCAGLPDPRCPATPSKCFELPPGEFIPIVIPAGIPASATKCSDAAGGATATFNLHNLDATILGGQSGTVSYYTDQALANAIAPNENAYVSGTAIIYAKITTNGVSNNGSAVSLTVNQRPNLVITNPTGVCSPNTVSISAAAVTAGSTLPSVTTLSYWTTQAANVAVPTPGAVGAGTYYIKATTNATPACTDIKAVTAAVNAIPVLAITNPAAACSPNTVSISAAAVTAGSTLPSVTTLSYWTTQDANVAVSDPGAVGNGTYYIKATTDAIPACTDIDPVVVTVNTTPVTPGICVVEPSLCGPSTGSVTILSPTGSGFEYSINNGTTWQSGTTFTPLVAGSVTGIKVKKDGCISAAALCNVSNCSSFTSPSSSKTSPVQSDALLQTTYKAIINTDNFIESPLAVKAYPNPFSDKIKFVITSSFAGHGNLEVQNIMGQKVKTIYQGYFAAGSRAFELNLPAKQVSNLVYVLRIGDKKMTGKILQVNQ